MAKSTLCQRDNQVGLELNMSTGIHVREMVFEYLPWFPVDALFYLFCNCVYASVLIFGNGLIIHYHKGCEFISKKFVGNGLMNLTLILPGTILKIRKEQLQVGSHF